MGAHLQFFDWVAQNFYQCEPNSKGSTKLTIPYKIENKKDVSLFPLPMCEDISSISTSLKNKYRHESTFSTAAIAFKLLLIRKEHCLSYLTTIDFFEVVGPFIQYFFILNKASNFHLIDLIDALNLLELLVGERISTSRCTWSHEYV